MYSTIWSLINRDYFIQRGIINTSPGCEDQQKEQPNYIDGGDYAPHAANPVVDEHSNQTVGGGYAPHSVNPVVDVTYPHQSLSESLSLLPIPGYTATHQRGLPHTCDVNLHTRPQK
jgi:hypothetical protein